MIKISHFFDYIFFATNTNRIKEYMNNDELYRPPNFSDFYRYVIIPQILIILPFVDFLYRIISNISLVQSFSDYGFFLINYFIFLFLFFSFEKINIRIYTQKKIDSIYEIYSFDSTPSIFFKFLMIHLIILVFNVVLFYLISKILPW